MIIVSTNLILDYPQLEGHVIVIDRGLIPPSQVTGSWMIYVRHISCLSSLGLLEHILLVFLYSKTKGGLIDECLVVYGEPWETLESCVTH